MFVSKTFNGVVIEIHMRDFNVICRETMGIYTESVVLGGDFNLAREEVFDRVIGPVMSKFEFVCFGTQGQTQELVSQTNPKNGKFSQNSLNGGDDMGEGFWIARAIRNKKTVIATRQERLGRNGRGVYLTLAPMACE